ncbi:hypothetical protein [Mycolicibacter arupensis]|jgi:hypothetical protein|uniref:Uncharacterized protein n=1 Tax=Mycolicibacter arupensis TaxID=342002 RepID=A0A5C7XL49_9MYCO|nr:hypothetical protein [Mycolicibacter arupensis]TXI50197.1 MAG: hypothetical protein E6Q54_21755 [Mycolicibacter arupensis]
MNDNINEPIDGSIYVTDVHPIDGLVYVTIAGDGDRPMIIMFDSDDLDVLNRARKELRAGIKEPDPGTVLQILRASRADRFVHDRVEYRYNPYAGEWVAWGRVDIDDGEPDSKPGVTFVTDRTW